MKPGCRTAPTRRLSNRRTAPRRTRPRPPPLWSGRSRSRVSRFGVLAAILCVLAGVAGAVLLARTRARDDAAAAHRTFERSSAQLTNSVRLALEKQEGLAVGAGCVLVESPSCFGRGTRRMGQGGTHLASLPGARPGGLRGARARPRTDGNREQADDGRGDDGDGGRGDVNRGRTTTSTAASTASAATEAAATGPGSGASTGPPRTTPVPIAPIHVFDSRPARAAVGLLGFRGAELLRQGHDPAAGERLRGDQLRARVDRPQAGPGGEGPALQGQRHAPRLLAAQGVVPRLAARAVGTHRGAAAGAPRHLRFRRAARLPPRVLARGAHQRHSAGRCAPRAPPSWARGGRWRASAPRSTHPSSKTETRAHCSWRGSSSASSSGDSCWSLTRRRRRVRVSARSVGR